MYVPLKITFQSDHAVEFPLNNWVPTTPFFFKGFLVYFRIAIFSNIPLGMNEYLPYNRILFQNVFLERSLI